MKKGDLVILALALVLAALPLLLLLPANATPAQVLVRQDGQLLRALPLDADCTVEFATEHGTNVVEVSGGAVRITFADCPDGTCMRMGPIRRTGETLVCLPHRLTVEITGAAESVDAVTR